MKAKKKYRPTKAYFITALTSEKVNRGMCKKYGYKYYSHKKCFGFASTQKLALEWVRDYGYGMVECLFDLLVVEEYGEGVEVYPPREVAWFRWSEKRPHRRWVRIGRPKDQKGIVCFAMP